MRARWCNPSQEIAMKTPLSLFILALLSVGPMSAAAQQSGGAETYPARPVKVVLPYAAGAAADIIGRIVAQKLSEATGSQFYVENLPGAGSTIGTVAAGRAPADGHTILVINQDFVVQPLVKSTTPYDPFKSFTAVASVAAAPETISVHPSVPATTMKELARAPKRQDRPARQAAEYQYAPAEALLGYMFQFGQGVPQNYLLVRIPWRSRTFISLAGWRLGIGSFQFGMNGATIGGGWERRISSSWTLRVEYRYTEFRGHDDQTVTFASNNPSTSTTTSGSTTTSTFTCNTCIPPITTNTTSSGSGTGFNTGTLSNSSSSSLSSQVSASLQTVRLGIVHYFSTY